jgi:ABC-type multidrug transport system fused ATPase/permease subunit
MIGEVITALLMPWPLKIVIDNIIFTGGPRGGRHLRTHLDERTIMLLIAVSVAALLIALFDAVFTYIDDRQTSVVAQRAINDLRLRVFARLQRLSLEFHQHRQTKVGDLLSRLGGDIQALQDLASDGISNLVTNGLALVSMVVVMAWLDWRLALVALVTTIPLVILARSITLRMRSALRVARRQEGLVGAVLQESLASVKLVQAFGREDHEDARLATESSKSLAAAVQAAELQARLNPLITVLSTIGTVAVTAFGVLLAVQRDITPGVLLVFLGYQRSMQSPVRQLAKLSYLMGKAHAGAERLDEALRVEPTIVQPPNARHLPSVSGRVTFEHVTFGYRPDAPVLRDIHLDVPAGNLIAIVGPTGAGKTTLVSLLPRFYDPTQGVVRIDGHDIRGLTLTSLRAQVGLVLQDSLLFSSTIRANIAYGRPDASPAEIEHAAQAAGVDIIAHRLERGYDTDVSERGASLSGGEKQCIGIARAILKNAPILILDEPTSSMDAHTEQLVLQGLRRLTQGRTVFAIAHRLATVQQANSVIVLRDGAIAEFGTPEQLLHREDGLFASLASAQAVRPNHELGRINGVTWRVGFAADPQTSGERRNAPERERCLEPEHRPPTPIRWYAER